MFGKLLSNVLMCFMKPSIERAADNLRNDPEIKRAFKELEIALQDLKEATERKNKFYDSEGWKSLKARYNV